jgi:hypothetical protein
MRHRLFLLLLAPVFLCMRCPYVSRVPLSGERLAYDPMLLGIWQYEGDQLRIQAVDKKQVRYQFWSKTEKPEDGLHGRAYLVRLGQTQFFVSGLEEKGEVRYMTFRLDTLTRDHLAITWLDDEEVEDPDQEFASSRAFTEFVKKANFSDAYRLDFRRVVADSTSRQR